MRELLQLSAGPLRLAIDPRTGGSIVSLDWWDGARSWEILRRSQGARRAIELASFPLVPFANRVRAAGFDFAGEHVLLSPNWPSDPSPIHGHGWLASWVVEGVTERMAHLSFSHQEDDWPWSYLASQTFELEHDELRVTLTCRNQSSRVMPCGLGQHPFFQCGTNTRLDAAVSHTWSIDAANLPVKRIAAIERLSLEKRLVCGQDLNHCYAGWSGRATIDDPGRPFIIELTSPGATFLQVYAPTIGAFVAVEPVTHAVAALNSPEGDWNGLGLQLLQPDEEASLEMRIRVIEKLRPAARTCSA